MDVTLDAFCTNADDHTAFDDPQTDYGPVRGVLTEPAGRILPPCTIG